MANTTWSKLKRSLSSKFSFRSAFKSSSSTTITSSVVQADDAPPPSAAAASTPPAPLPPRPFSSSISTTTTTTTTSLSSRLSRTFSLRSSSKICAICLRSLRKGQGEAIFFAECSHPFHFNCIANNVKHGNLVCPVCRSEWKDLPFQAPANAFDPQRNAAGRARVSPYTNNARPILPESEHFSDDEPISVVPVDSSSPPPSQTLTLKSFPEYPALLASDCLPKFGVLVHIRAPPLDDISSHRRAPIDLVTVLDVSGSMADKMALLKCAVSFIIQNLGPSDRLSIVTFSSRARRVLRLTKMSDSGRTNALSVVNSLAADGGTNIVDGLKKAVRVLEERRYQNPVASIILLSDGRDTQRCSPETRSEYLKLLPASICATNVAAGTESPQATFPVHAFGFGVDHDATTMHAISDASRGTFSFIETIDILQDAFARCIGGLLSVVAEDVQLKVGSVCPGVQIESIPSGRHKNKISDQGRQAVIDIGNLYAEEEKEFLVYLSIPESSAADGQERSESTPLVAVSCSLKESVSRNIVQAGGVTVEIRRPQALSPTDQLVCLEFDRQRNRLAVMKAIADAQSMAELGNLEGAKVLLAEQRSALLSTASAQAGDGLCIWLEAELREIEQRMVNRESYERSGRAYVLSGISSHTSQRATTRGHTTSFIITRGEGNSGLDTTTSYETPSMTSMVSRSQVLNSASATLLDKSKSSIIR
ncbi:hypothetical protein Tsubulata_009861 [Turnera subulata]|uniref:RING-type domain-containing protein n=1 Tax=Turnera subulata TaxID=218843 RepID=A0A9Q0FKM0_9ROSI|nr:hypothetical protein Tsubulata_009861 [Turnera subulata]